MLTRGTVRSVSERKNEESRKVCKRTNGGRGKALYRVPSTYRNESVSGLKKMRSTTGSLRESFCVCCMYCLCENLCMSFCTMANKGNINILPVTIQ